ncbi:methyltransferase, TIGR04325 family [Helicobacter canis]|uniref:Methyltransferase, TIGR04325 family n=1 Tax=Helicobacter canis NCTC 12740 TaxID=1357399 RepID=V8CGU5_9HELI|nr:methyltransferase, TIGR04325 family [Helicobacter canis]ETD25941.1 hypothetical protein HMPREF2087_01779 [Helicobacter canis NCTC 12740]
MNSLHFIKMAIKRAVWFMRDVRSHYFFTSPRAFGCSRGVFESFAQAVKSAPKHAKINYTEQDEKESFQNFISNFSYKLADYEYPAFYHLTNILTKIPQAKILDFGGGFGGHYFRYCHHTKNTPNWQVCETVNKVKFGDQIISHFNTSTLSFTQNPHTNCNILLSSGAIQYVEHFETLLHTLLHHNNGGGGGVTHILLERIPIQNKSQTFVTLQNHGSFYQPQYVFNKKEFLIFFEKLGYVVIDEWNDYIDSAIIPFHRDISANNYQGFYLQKQN